MHDCRLHLNLNDLGLVYHLQIISRGAIHLAVVFLVGCKCQNRHGFAKVATFLQFK